MKKQEYKKLLIKLTKKIKWVKLGEPCSIEKLNAAQSKVGLTFPEELKNLLLEVDGDGGWLLMSAEEIVENRVDMRQDWSPFFKENNYVGDPDGFLLFAQNGCGDYYGYQIKNDGTVDQTAIYMWNHEEIGEETCYHKVASNLTEFIKLYYKDKI